MRGTGSWRLILGCMTGVILAVVWNHQYALLNAALRSLRAPPPPSAARIPAAPAPPARAPGEPAIVAPAPAASAPEPVVAVEPPASPAVEPGGTTDLPAADVSTPAAPPPSIAGSGAALDPAAGPLIKLRAANGAERVGVVLDKGVALGPIMDLAFEPGLSRMESLATEPLALYSVRAARTVPVVNPLGEKPGAAVKICGVGEDGGLACVPARLRGGPEYHAPADQVLLEAGSFSGEFPGGAALFKTGAGGGLLGYQPAPVKPGGARFILVNYLGRFSALRTALAPMLDVAFSDLLMNGRRRAAEPPAPATPAPEAQPASPSAPASAAAAA